MANLKLDLKNKIGNDKYYHEMELIRLAQEPNMNYKDKIEQMSYMLQSIASINSQLALVEQYFQEAPLTQAGAQQQFSSQQPSGQVHQGQSHGE